MNDSEEVKNRASGQWGYIISRVCGISSELLDSKHHPCPKHCFPDAGGIDRFRAYDDFSLTGGTQCNRCGVHADGFATVMWALDVDFPTAVKEVKNALGMFDEIQDEFATVMFENPGFKPTEDSGWPNLMFDFEPDAEKLLDYCRNKAGVTPDGLKLAGVRTGFHYVGRDYSVVCFPFYNSHGLCGYSVSRVDGELIPTAPGKAAKNKNIKGSRPGLFGNLSALKTCKEIWKLEGETDVAALLSCGVPEGVLVVTNANGSKENGDKYKWFADIVADKPVYVLHDNDDDGRIGGEKWARFFAATSPTFLCTWGEFDSKDVRDFVVAEGGVAELMSLRLTAHQIRVKVELQPSDLEYDPDSIEEHAATKAVLSQELLSPGGLMSELMADILDQSRFEIPELTLAAVIAFMGLILGRRVIGEDGTTPNVFVMGLAESGVGKNAPRSRFKRIMTESHISNWADSFTSGAAIATLLEKHPSCLVMLDEAGLEFQNMKNSKGPAAGLGKDLSEIFTSAMDIYRFKSYSNTKNNKVINQPSLSIYATSTPQSLYKGGVDLTDLEQGLFGRFLVFRPEVMDPEEKFDLKVREPSPELLDKVTAWWDFGGDYRDLANFSPTPVPATKTPAAQERYIEYARSVSARLKNDSNLERALWRRAREKTQKLALIHACSLSGPAPRITIDIDSMNWAIGVSNYCSRSMVVDHKEEVASTVYELNCHRVLSMIPETGIAAWRLNRNCRFVNPKEREQIVADLQTTGAIEVKKVSKNVPGPVGAIIYKVQRISRPLISSVESHR